MTYQKYSIEIHRVCGIYNSCNHGDVVRHEYSRNTICRRKIEYLETSCNSGPL
jgi:hypothetical protein